MVAFLYTISNDFNSISIKPKMVHCAAFPKKNFSQLYTGLAQLIKLDKIINIWVNGKQLYYDMNRRIYFLHKVTKKYGLPCSEKTICKKLQFNDLG